MSSRVNHLGILAAPPAVQFGMKAITSIGRRISSAFYSVRSHVGEQNSPSGGSPRRQSPTRPPYLSDEEWRQYLALFNRAPLSANHMLVEMEIERNIEYSCAWPLNMQLSLTPLCNIMCRFCSQTQFHKRQTPLENTLSLTLDKVQSIFREIEVGYPLHLDFAGDGEPLIDPHFREIYLFLRPKFPHTYFRTCSNGLSLTREMSEFLVENKLAWLNISMNAASREVWERTTGSKEYDRVIDNIRYLQALKQRRGVRFPELGMTYVVARYNMDDLSNYVALCSELGVVNASATYMTIVDKEQTNDSVVWEKAKINRLIEQARVLAERLDVKIRLPEPFTSFSENEEVPLLEGFDFGARRKEYVKSYKEALVQLATYTGPKPINSISDVSARPLMGTFKSVRCTYPWDYISFVGDATARICCGGIGSEQGNAEELGYWAIWNGPVRRFMRRTVNTDQIDKICYYCPLNKTRDQEDIKMHQRPEAWE